MCRAAAGYVCSVSVDRFAALLERRMAVDYDSDFRCDFMSPLVILYICANMAAPVRRPDQRQGVVAAGVGPMCVAVETDVVRWSGVCEDRRDKGWLSGPC